MLFSFARIDAALSMRVQDSYANGRDYWIRLREQGGKELLVLSTYRLDDYMKLHLSATGRRRSVSLWENGGGAVQGRSQQIDLIRKKVSFEKFGLAALGSIPDRRIS